MEKIIRAIRIRLKNKKINKKINLFINKNIVCLPREEILKPEIIIPCFNHGKYLEDALGSIPSEISITIINDCSTDNTLLIIEALKKKFNFKLINNKVNLNQVGSINNAIESSNNNLFIILNADDALNKLAVKTILSFYEKFPNIRMLGAGAITFSDNNLLKFNQILPDSLPYTPSMKIYNKSTAKNYKKLNDINMTMSGSSFLKSAWQSVGGFYPYKERVCSYDDRDFQMRVSALFDVGVIEEPLAFYRINSSTGVSQQ